MPTIKLEASEVEYFIDGSGFPLVLIHGTGGNADTNWGHLVDRLKNYRKVIRPNYSGSGNTTSDLEPLSIEKIAEQIISCADAAGAKKFDLIGYSLGASVATFIAGEHPDRVRSLVLLAGFASSNDSRLKLQFHLWKRLIETDYQSAAEMIILTGFSPSYLSSLPLSTINEASESIISNNNWEGMKLQVDLDLNVDVKRYAKKIVCPTLSIGCTHDYMIAPKHAKELHKLISGSSYVELSSGHLAPLEVPEQFLDVTIQFLETL
ncbi:alpha/beta fold hydrolase [Sodalis sp. RH20]|uniref:alpha/beta fold hydrolase n=1 Tax=unclassified Sodalis (in: enterobacteria) TaxID=2636512 RepID=UPI0039B53F5C